ncbi:MAG: YceI family protein [Candidatus Binataceae bacterium]
MRTKVFAATMILFAVIVISAPASAASPQSSKGTLALDPAHTRISFTLGGPLHTTSGTFRLKHGTITADPATGQASGNVVIDASSANTGESMRDAKMKDSVLEASRYPEIDFVPEKVAGHEDSDGNFTAHMTGILRLHGSDHEITLGVSGQVVGDSLTASTHFVVPYVAWGMTNPGILFLRVDSVVDLTIEVSGHVTWIAAAANR